MHTSPSPGKTGGKLFRPNPISWRQKGPRDSCIDNVPRDKIRPGVVSMCYYEDVKEPVDMRDFFVAVKPKSPNWLTTKIKASRDPVINKSLVTTAGARGWIVLRKEKRERDPVIYQGDMTDRDLSEKCLAKARMIMRGYNNKQSKHEKEMHRQGKKEYQAPKLTESEVKAGILNAQRRADPFDDD